MKNILIIAAHADDEVLGCGGTIAKFSDNGARVSVFLLADGVSSRGAGKEEIAVRTKIASKAIAHLGAEMVDVKCFPDNKMDTVPRLEVAQSIEKVIEEIRPDTVFTHFPYDLNVDHRRVSEAVLVATRPQPGSTVKDVLFWENLSSTEWNFTPEQNFSPNYFIDISKFLDTKIEALKFYKDEMRPWPHARSPETVVDLAKWRGSAVGVKAAEAFVLGRSVN